ncbi:hypothetical protein [Marinoscillum sp. MHG1-6]|uniref:hypothetical protein n=1 Tax=Marinoscillum sp. MHG1-6 TaxID=2959627 RepID=UPI0021578974|nr:hypothetical protein [Marinoscillum sp. MHG1-6]
MKVLLKDTSLRVFLFLVALLVLQLFLLAQTRPSIAIISIDTKDIELDDESMANLVRLELEKIDQYEVLDKYDVQDAISKEPNPGTNYFGKKSVLSAGRILGTDKMLTGAVERYGDKIVFILRLIDVKAEAVEKSSVMEYQDVQSEIQTMAMISVKDLLEIPNDQHLVDLLINYDLPVTTMKTTMSLNGPRMGAVYMAGDNGARLRASRLEGGFDMFPVTSMFGYQFEKQYLSSGQFQALVEIITAVNGLESGKLIPSVSFINGFRFSKSGMEFGLGPNLRVTRVEDGFYVGDRWYRTEDVITVPSNTEVVRRIDSRGTLHTSLGLIIAVGKTFKSGYLNIPFNVYVLPRKDGTTVGLTFGFNTTNRPKL